jgi:hypothetical protein
MNPLNNPPADQIHPGDRIVTACGGYTRYLPGIESASYNGKTVYFCLPACKKDFELDPRRSCLAMSITEDQ